MKTTERFENAVTKLYTAFHKGELSKGKCDACAVGNICDNNGDWKLVFVTEERGVQYINPENYVDNIGNSNFMPKTVIVNTGYSWQELAQIEQLFENNTRYTTYGGDYFFDDITDDDVFLTKEDLKADQFIGLCAVVEYLCELDGIPNVMEVQSLFGYEGEKKQLTEVFA